MPLIENNDWVLYSNKKNPFAEYLVFGLSQDGVCTDYFENPSVNSLKQDNQFQPISFPIGQ